MQNIQFIRLTEKSKPDIFLHLPEGPYTSTLNIKYGLVNLSCYSTVDSSHSNLWQAAADTLKS